MSLARLIYENTSCGGNSSIDTSMYDFSNTTCESYELDIACETLITDIYAVDRAYMIADVVGEVKCMTENLDPVTVLEGVNGGAKEKLVNVFKKFLAKIKSFFAAVKRQFQLIFKHGKEFINAFKKELDAKDAKGYSYKATKYTFDEGKAQCEKLFNHVDKEIARITADIGSARTADIDEDKIKASIYGNGGRDDPGRRTKDSLKDFQDNFIKGAGIKGGPTDISELKSELYKAFRNGDGPSDEDPTHEDFEDLSKGEMMDFINTFNKKVTDLEKVENKFEKNCNAIIKALKSIKEGEEFKTSREEVASGRIPTSYSHEGKVSNKQYEYAREASSAMSHILNVGKVPCDIEIAALKEAASTYERVLKGYLRFKPAKESAAPDGDEMEDPNLDDGVKEGYNLIDSILSSLI